MMGSMVMINHTTTRIKQCMARVDKKSHKLGAMMKGWGE